MDTARSYSGDARFPVFANGGIEFAEGVRRCLDETKASGVMSSESLLEFPGLFGSRPGESYTARGLLERQRGYADASLDYATVLPPLPGSSGSRGGSFNGIWSHLFKFLHRYLEENPDLRSRLGDRELNTIKGARDIVWDLRTRYENVDKEGMRKNRSWGDDSSWYRRHWRSATTKDELIPSMSLEERKRLARLRIKRMQGEKKIRLGI